MEDWKNVKLVVKILIIQHLSKQNANVDYLALLKQQLVLVRFILQLLEMPVVIGIL